MTTRVRLDFVTILNRVLNFSNFNYELRDCRVKLDSLLGHGLGQFKHDLNILKN